MSPMISPSSVRLSRAALLPVALLLLTCSFAAESRIRVLIVDGQNNHAWPTTTSLLRKILEHTGRFTVDVSTSPPAAPPAPRLPRDATATQRTEHAQALRGHTAEVDAHRRKMAGLWMVWRPRFSDYAAVISNYNG